MPTPFHSRTASVNACLFICDPFLLSVGLSVIGIMAIVATLAQCRQV